MRFKEEALQAQEAVAAEEEGKKQAMLFTMLQDQHTKQITQMEATNKANKEAMMEKMNALVASNKENTHQGGNVKPTGTGKRERSPGRKRHYASTVNALCSTSPRSATNWRQTKQSATQDGSPFLRRHQPLDRDRGQR